MDHSVFTAYAGNIEKMANSSKKHSQNDSFYSEEMKEPFLSDDHLFLICLIIVELLGLIIVGLSISWMLQIGGFGLQAKTIFNYHPPLLTLSMIFLNANGTFPLCLLFLFSLCLVFCRYFNLSLDSHSSLSNTKVYSSNVANSNDRHFLVRLSRLLLGLPA